VVEPVVGISLLVVFGVALISLNKVSLYYGVTDGVIVLLIGGLAIFFASTYILFQFKMLERIAGKATLLIQKVFSAQAPTWQTTISSEFYAYSPADKIAYDALMSQRDEAGCVTLDQVRSWHAKEIQALKSLQEISSEQEVRKICISQPE